MHKKSEKMKNIIFFILIIFISKLHVNKFSFNLGGNINSFHNKNIKNIALGLINFIPFNFSFYHNIICLFIFITKFACKIT